MIRIANYQGRSFPSWLIRRQTRSLWGHSLVIHRDDSITESWYRGGGVSHVDEGNLTLNLSKNHTDQTIVDIFHIESTDAQARHFEDFVLSQVGMKYDLKSVLRFVTKRPATENNRWFCSELVAHGLQKSGIYLQKRIKSAHMSPQLVGISPIMCYMGHVVTNELEVANNYDRIRSRGIEFNHRLGNVS